MDVSSTLTDKRDRVDSDQDHDIRSAESMALQSDQRCLDNHLTRGRSIAQSEDDKVVCTPGVDQSGSATVPYLA